MGLGRVKFCLIFFFSIKITKRRKIISLMYIDPIYNLKKNIFELLTCAILVLKVAYFSIICLFAQILSYLSFWILYEIFVLNFAFSLELTKLLPFDIVLHISPVHIPPSPPCSLYKPTTPSLPQHLKPHMNIILRLKQSNKQTNKEVFLTTVFLKFCVYDQKFNQS